MSSVTVDKRTGNLVIRTYVGVDGATGRPRQISKTLPAESSADEIKAAQAELELKAGRARTTGSGYTISDLVDFYLDGLVVYGHAPSTIAAYKSMARCYVEPFIGARDIDHIAAHDFAMLYRRLLLSGGKDGNPLSAVTVKKLHAMLSGCFNTLVRDGIIDANPLIGVKVPRGISPEAQPLTEDDYSKLVAYLLGVFQEINSADFDWATSDNTSEYVYAVAWWLCLHTGIRRGELAGLRIQDYSQRMSMSTSSDAGMLWHPGIRIARAVSQVSVRGAEKIIIKEPKSTHGKRTITIDERTNAVVQDYIHRRSLSGITHAEDPLFCHKDGSLIKPSEYTKAFSNLVKKLGLARYVHLHTLRHTHATYLLSEGEGIKVVQERLGHSKIDVTLGIYGHVLPGRDAQAAQIIGELSQSLYQKNNNGYVPKCPLSGDICARFKKGK